MGKVSGRGYTAARSPRVCSSAAVRLRCDARTPLQHKAPPHRRECRRRWYGGTVWNDELDMVSAAANVLLRLLHGRLHAQQHEAHSQTLHQEPGMGVTNASSKS
jgi:hypothetical protein